MGGRLTVLYRMRYRVLRSIGNQALSGFLHISPSPLNQVLSGSLHPALCSLAGRGCALSVCVCVRYGAPVALVSSSKVRRRCFGNPLVSLVRLRTSVLILTVCPPRMRPNPPKCGKASSQFWSERTASLKRHSKLLSKKAGAAQARGNTKVHYTIIAASVYLASFFPFYLVKSHFAALYLAAFYLAPMLQIRLMMIVSGEIAEAT